MATQLTPYAAARVRRWMLLLSTDATAPPWNPRLGASTPASLRAAAWWLVARGHAAGLDHQMVCILLALAIADDLDGAGEEPGGEPLPRDAA
jgi:hypothetical protein